MVEDEDKCGTKRNLITKERRNLEEVQNISEWN
jgi:hypothetical protein